MSSVTHGRCRTGSIWIDVRITRKTVVLIRYAFRYHTKVGARIPKRKKKPIPANGDTESARRDRSRFQVKPMVIPNPLAATAFEQTCHVGRCSVIVLCGSGRGPGWVRWGRPLLSLGRPPLGPSPRISTGSCVTCSSPCVCGSNRLMSELVCLCGSVLSWDSRSVTVCSSRVRLCAHPECVCVCPGSPRCI